MGKSLSAAETSPNVSSNKSSLAPQYTAGSGASMSSNSQSEATPPANKSAAVTKLLQKPVSSSTFAQEASARSDRIDENVVALPVSIPHAVALPVNSDAKQLGEINKQPTLTNLPVALPAVKAQAETAVESGQQVDWSLAEQDEVTSGAADKEVAETRRYRLLPIFVNTIYRR